MSWRATAYVKGVITCPNAERIGRTEKFLALILADYYNDEDGAAWASVRALSEDALMSERHCRSMLRQLERKGLIQTVLGGIDRSNSYRFPALKGGQPLPRPRKRRGAAIAPQGGQPLPLGGEISPPEGGQFQPRGGEIATSEEQEETRRNGEEGVEVGSRPRSPQPTDEPRNGFGDWGEDQWLKDFLLSQTFVNLPADYFLDRQWWENESVRCHGLPMALLEGAFAALGNKLKERPQSRPMTRKGWLQKMSNFLRIEREIIERGKAKTARTYGNQARR